MHMRLTAFLVFTALASAVMAQQDPPQWSAAANVVGGGLFRGSDGNYYRALKTAMNHDPTTDNHVYWELYYVRVPTTLAVGIGKRFTSLKTAWAFAAAAHIVAPASVNIAISTTGGAYAESFASPFSLNQENGDMITITGDVANKINLTFSSGIDGFQITNAHRLGGINGVTISGTSPGATGTGLMISDQSHLGASVLQINSFRNCVAVVRNSQLDCSHSSFSSFTGQAMDVEMSSNVQAQSVLVNGGSTGLDAFYAYTGSVIDATSATAQNVTRYGFFAGVGATIEADYATSTTCPFGFSATAHGTISAKGSTCTGSTSYGYFAQGAAFIRTIGYTQSGNATPFSPPVNTLGTDGSIITG